MPIRSCLIQDLFHHFEAGGFLKAGEADAKTTKILEASPIPMDLKRTLQWNWIVTRGDVGPYTLIGVNEITSEDDFEELLRYRMIPIGSALNGDILALRYDDDECSVGLVSHDQFLEGVSDPEDAYVEIAGSIDEFLLRAAEKRYLPFDYNVAVELAQLRRKESTDAGETK